MARGVCSLSSSIAPPYKTSHKDGMHVFGDKRLPARKGGSAIKYRSVACRLPRGIDLQWRSATSGGPCVWQPIGSRSKAPDHTDDPDTLPKLESHFDSLYDPRRDDMTAAGHSATTRSLGEYSIVRRHLLISLAGQRGGPRIRGCEGSISFRALRMKPAISLFASNRRSGWAQSRDSLGGPVKPVESEEIEASMLCLRQHRCMYYSRGAVADVALAQSCPSQRGRVCRPGRVAPRPICSQHWVMADWAASACWAGTVKYQAPIRRDGECFSSCSVRCHLAQELPAFLAHCRHRGE